MPIRNSNAIGGTKGALKKKPNKSFESAAIRAGKAPRNKDRRLEVKANAQKELKSIKTAQKQTTTKPLQKKQNVKPSNPKPSKFKKAVATVKKAVSNTMRKGMQMLKKMAKPTPKRATPARTIRRSKPKR